MCYNAFVFFMRKTNDGKENQKRKQEEINMAVKYVFVRMAECFYHMGPVGQIRFRAWKVKALADNLRQVLFLHGKRSFVQILHVQVLQNMA